MGDWNGSSICISAPDGMKDAVFAAAQARGMSVSAFVRSLIDAELAGEGGDGVSTDWSEEHAGEVCVCGCMTLPIEEIRARLATMDSPIAERWRALQREREDYMPVMPRAPFDWLVAPSLPKNDAGGKEHVMADDTGIEAAQRRAREFNAEQRRGDARLEVEIAGLRERINAGERATLATIKAFEARLIAVEGSEGTYVLSDEMRQDARRNAVQRYFRQRHKDGAASGLIELGDGVSVRYDIFVEDEDALHEHAGAN